MKRCQYQNIGKVIFKDFKISIKVKHRFNLHDNDPEHFSSFNKIKFVLLGFL